MGSREDDDYWNNKYDGEWFAGSNADASCYEHGVDEMYYDHSKNEHYCLACQREEEELGNEETDG